MIYNPTAGRGRARRLVERARRIFPEKTAFQPTRAPGHAVALAAEASHAGFERIVAAGGDGTVHEVANGILQAGRSGVTFSVLPIGSSNDYAYALGLVRWWKSGSNPEQLSRMQVDVGRVSWAGGDRYFVNGLGIGFNGMVTAEARTIGYLRGMPLYATALLRALWRRFATPETTVELDGIQICGPTLALSISLGMREGGFPLFRSARLDDGLFDTLRVGALRRRDLLRYFPRLISGRLPTNDPEIQTGRCRSARVSSVGSLCVHVDGELIAESADGVHELSVSLLPAALSVEVCQNGRPHWAISCAESRRDTSPGRGRSPWKRHS